MDLSKVFDCYTVMIVATVYVLLVLSRDEAMEGRDGENRLIDWWIKELNQ